LPTSSSTLLRLKIRRHLSLLSWLALLGTSAGTAWGHITSLSPPATTAGVPAFTLIVNGFDYDNTDELIWNTQTLARCAPVRVAPCFALISSTRMEIAVPASFVATPGTVTVSLRGFNSVSFIINPRPMITTASPLPNGLTGSAYSVPLNATGGTAPLRWSISVGSLAAGLAFDPSGRVSGTPTTAGASTFTVVVTDSMLVTDTKVFTLTITAPAGTVTITIGSPLRNSCIDIQYVQSLAAGGGTGPYAWTVAGGALPAGLSLSTAGVISGTPSLAGTFTVTIRATDMAGATATRDFVLVVAGPNPAERVILSQIADGGPDGEWKTTFTSFNSSTGVQGAVRFRFFSSDGTPLTLPLTDAGRVSSVTRQIAAGGSTVIETIGADTTLSQGWVEVTSCGAGGSGPSVNSFAIFRQRVLPRGDVEATVISASSVASEIGFAFDNREGFVTSLAIVNPTQTAAPVTATFRRPDGGILHQETFTIPPFGHVAWGTNTRFPLSADQRGVVVFSASAGALAPLGLRFSPNNSFTALPHLTLR
jgi:hypothetical protein